MAKLPLDGVRILDLARLGPGPHASQILGDFGADIIKVEPPSRGGRELTMPDVLRRNTRSMRLNLKKPEGREVFEKLVAQVDVVVEGFRPGVAKKLGMDYDSLARIREDIISVSLSGLGQDGPYALMAAHDLNYQSLAGIPHMTGDLDGPPKIPGNAIADDAGGISAALAIMIAMFHRERTGEGQYVDFAMVDTLLNMMLLQLNEVQESGVSPRRGETTLSGKYAFYNIYECADGKSVSLGTFEPWFWERLCGLLGVPEFAQRQYPDSEPEREAQKARLREIFLTKPRDTWVEMLMLEDTCVSPVLSLDEVMANEHHRARGAILSGADIGAGFIDQVGMIYKFSRTPGSIRRKAPETGADTEAILRDLDYDGEQLQSLLQEITTL
ncbi:MAG: CaiB/BaiF CoA-transferase family protein [Halioglobus sp.]|nr:CaiB/BaiF CoA-transferase family protein [Halioglobus sp.]